MSNPSLFLRFLRHPGRVGALCPSSPALCRMMVCNTGVEQAGLVVELGPGTGVITREILARAGAGTRVLALELDAGLCANLTRRFPSLTVRNESAAELVTILRREQLPVADAVISGLPWAIFPRRLQEEILNAVVAGLRPGGVFTTFAYLQGAWLPAGRRFQLLLRERFARIERTPVVWNNLPPAFVYRCFRG